MINILVIEDDVSIREIINYNLSNKFSVLTADNAEEGLEICQEEKIDLLLKRYKIWKDLYESNRSIAIKLNS